MKFLIFKRYLDKNANRINSTDFSVKDLKVIEIDEDAFERSEMEDEAINRYKDVSGYDPEEDCEIICSVVNKGLAQLPIDTYCCKRVYSDDTEIVNIYDKVTGKNYPAVMVIGRIPANHVPTDEEILKCYFRGDIRHMEASTKIPSIKLATPFERISVDLGSKSLTVPLLNRFEIETLE